MLEFPSFFFFATAFGPALIGGASDRRKAAGFVLEIKKKKEKEGTELKFYLQPRDPR